MNLSLYDLRLVLVVILCIPIAYFGVRFTMSLVDHAVAGRKKTGSANKRSRRGEQTEADDSDELR